MKKHMLLTSLVISILFAIGVTMASAIPVTITYTADNIVGGWWVQNGGDPVSQALGSNAATWWLADTVTVDLPLNDHVYQVIWQVTNTGTPSATNPGGFVAEIAQNPQLTEADWLSSSSWEVAVVYGSLSAPSDFSALTWVSATQIAANNGSPPWYTVIPGISQDAQWIWTAANFGAPGAPGPNDSVFIRTLILTDAPPNGEDGNHVVPEPSTLLLLGAGLVGISVAYRKRSRKQNKVQ